MVAHITASFWKLLGKITAYLLRVVFKIDLGIFYGVSRICLSLKHSSTLEKKNENKKKKKKGTSGHCWHPDMKLLKEKNNKKKKVIRMCLHRYMYLPLSHDPSRVIFFFSRYIYIISYLFRRFIFLFFILV